MEARSKLWRKDPLLYGEIAGMVRRSIDEPLPEHEAWSVTLSNYDRAKRARMTLYQAARRLGVAVTTRITTNTDGTSDVLWSLRKEVGE